MFYANENTSNKFGSFFLEKGVRCYDIIELPGFMPMYLVEMPILSEDGELEARKPLLVNNLNSVIGLKDGYEFPLEAVNVWMFFQGFMNNSEGWQVQRITSIWEGTWLYKKEELISTKLQFANGDSVQLLGNPPMNNAKVKWAQVL